MNIEGYKKLSASARANYLWIHGKFVDERVEFKKAKILIYSLNNFYVEIRMGIDNDRIEYVKPLDTLNDWQGYMDSLSLDYLMRWVP